MERNDKILDSFGWRCIRANAAVPLICIYSSPTDYPGKYVARLWDMMRPTNLVTVSDSLEGIRQTIPDGIPGLHRHGAPGEEKRNEIPVL